MKTISLIVPLYNVEQTVLGCLESIRMQTYADFECLCIDDGSPDRSAELVADYIADDARFSLIRQQNKGLGGARNTGIDHAQGKWVAFVDSDDYIHPRMLEILLTAAQQSGSPIAGCELQTTPQLYTPMPLHALSKSEPKRVSDPLGSYLRKQGIATSACGKLYRRDLLGDYRFVEGIYYEDTPWAVEILGRAACYARVEQPLYYYYKNEGSIMRSDWTEKKTEDFVFVIREIYESSQRLRPSRLGEVRDCHLSPLIKMLFNRIRRSSKQARPRLWTHATPLIKQLVADGCIGYQGMKIKHKIRLWLLLR